MLYLLGIYFEGQYGVLPQFIYKKNNCMEASSSIGFSTYLLLIFTSFTA